MAGNTTANGYGWQHQKLRAHLIATYNPATPCWRCGYALGPIPQLLDLGHDDTDKRIYPASSTDGATGQQVADEHDHLGRHPHDRGSGRRLLLLRPFPPDRRPVRRFSPYVK